MPGREGGPVEGSDWLTMPDAAQQLGISPRTIRRWIKEGKVRAELRPGPYGQQYYVPATQIHTAQELTDVVRVERQVDRADLARAMDGYLREREGALVAALETLHAVVGQAAQRQEERDIALRQEFSEALAGVRESQAAQVEAARLAVEQAAIWQERVRQLEAENARLQEHRPQQPASTGTRSAPRRWPWWGRRSEAGERRSAPVR